MGMSNIVKSKTYNLLRVKSHKVCGDLMLQTEIIDNEEYEIYLGYNGYLNHYAVKKGGN